MIAARSSIEKRAILTELALIYPFLPGFRVFQWCLHESVLRNKRTIVTKLRPLVTSLFFFEQRWYTFAVLIPEHPNYQQPNRTISKPYSL